MPAEQEESLPLPSETEEALTRTVAPPKLPREKQEEAASDPVSDTSTPDHNETKAEPDIASVDTVIISPSALPQKQATGAFEEQITSPKEEAEPEIASIGTLVIPPSALPPKPPTGAADDKTIALPRGTIARALAPASQPTAASEVPNTPYPDDEGNQPTDKLNGDNQPTDKLNGGSRTHKQRKASSARRGLGHDVAAFIDESRNNGADESGRKVRRITLEVEAVTVSTHEGQIVETSSKTSVLEIGVQSSRTGILKALAFGRKVEKAPWYADSWLVATMIISYMAGIGAFYYYYQAHQIILYGDAYAHMLIIRRLFDSATPGLAQLGGIWLPLPHLVMLPFIWNDFLWRTGLAGTIPSMICYIVASHYLFLSMRRLTRSSRASFVGSLVFILNPNVLYLQTTALSEIVLIATLTASSYYFLVWVQEDSLNHLLLAAAATFLATLTRYDGWFLFVVFLALIVPIGLLKRQQRAQIEGHLILFGSLGGLGIVLWLLWCYIIFGDPLFFQRSQYSSQAMQMTLYHAHALFTYHDLWQSFRYYFIDAGLNIGWGLFLLACFAIVLFLIQRRITPESLATLIFLAPFAFYVVSLYGGQAAIYVPGAVPANFEHQIYNARYGVEFVAPAALFLATLVSSFRQRFLLAISQILLVILLLGQSVWTTYSGIISLQDGLYGLDCSHSHAIVIYLAQHYNGGRILEDLYSTKIDALNPEANIDFSQVIYEGSGSLWEQALRNPSAYANWVIVNQADTHDEIAKKIDPRFYAEFTRDVEESDGLSLYHRNGLQMTTRAVPEFYLTQHALCGSSDITIKQSEPSKEQQQNAMVPFLSRKRMAVV